MEAVGSLGEVSIRLYISNVAVAMVVISLKNRDPRVLITCAFTIQVLNIDCLALVLPVVASYRTKVVISYARIVVLCFRVGDVDQESMPVPDATQIVRILNGVRSRIVSYQLSLLDFSMVRRTERSRLLVSEEIVEVIDLGSSTTTKDVGNVVLFSFLL